MSKLSTRIPDPSSGAEGSGLDRTVHTLFVATGPHERQDEFMPTHPDEWLGALEPRLAQQLHFLIEADRLKTVLRGSRISDGTRKENTAEHSWHLALFAMLLGEWSDDEVDIARVMKMLVLHDLVEIDCGDTPLFDEKGSQTQAEREKQAADRLFGLLPADQRLELRALWDEFEDGSSADAAFAKSLDRIQPIILNHLNRGGTWTDYAVDVERERSLTNSISNGSSRLWDVAGKIFDEAVKGGWLRA